MKIYFAIASVEIRKRVSLNRNNVYKVIYLQKSTSEPEKSKNSNVYSQGIFGVAASWCYTLHINIALHIRALRTAALKMPTLSVDLFLLKFVDIIHENGNELQSPRIKLGHAVTLQGSFE